jgi:hypothetical protein
MDAAMKRLALLIEDNPGASEEEIQNLFLPAFMDEPEVKIAVLKVVLKEMFAFDPGRAEQVVVLMNEGDPAAEEALESMLQDMQPQ